MSCEKECLLERVLETDNDVFNTGKADDFLDLSEDNEYVKTDEGQKFLEVPLHEMVILELADRAKEIEVIGRRILKLKWQLLEEEQRMKELCANPYRDNNRFYGNSKEEFIYIS